MSTNRPPSSSPPPLSAAAAPSKALVKCSKNADGERGYNPVVEVDELEKIPGLSRYDGEGRECEPRRGVVWDLVVTGMGEAQTCPSRALRLPGVGISTHRFAWRKYQGRALVALSWVKMHSYDLGITNKRALGPLQIPDAMIYVHLHILRALEEGWAERRCRHGAPRYFLPL